MDYNEVLLSPSNFQKNTRISFYKVPFLQFRSKTLMKKPFLADSFKKLELFQGWHLRDILQTILKKFKKNHVQQDTICPNMTLLKRCAVRLASTYDCKLCFSYLINLVTTVFFQDHLYSFNHQCLSVILMRFFIFLIEVHLYLINSQCKSVNSNLT